MIDPTLPRLSERQGNVLAWLARLQDGRPGVPPPPKCGPETLQALVRKSVVWRHGDLVSAIGHRWLTAHPEFAL